MVETVELDFHIRLAEAIEAWELEMLNLQLRIRRIAAVGRAFRLRDWPPRIDQFATRRVATRRPRG